MTCNSCEFSRIKYLEDTPMVVFGCVKANKNVGNPMSKFAASYLILEAPAWCPIKGEELKIDWTKEN